uniref:Uncharacterized protein n=1 Tax=Triticum urartu TaxID=4572 RepID=A0A8R7U9C5_TRIUA
LEVASVLDDDVVHVGGAELRKVPRERDEVEAAVAAVELHHVAVLVVALPAVRAEALLQRLQRPHRLVRRHVHQRLVPRPAPARRRPGRALQLHHPVLPEHPHASVRHGRSLWLALVWR